MPKAPSRKSKTRIGIVVSKFNELITQRLLKGCLRELNKSGIKERDLTVVWVPGAFDIPVVALALAKKKSIDAVICLGAVIRGETYHFELVAEGAAYGISQAALISGKPVIFGVLSTDTIEQANRRSDDKRDNKGRDAAQNALEMIHLLRQLS
jgi:6,7-dimethyl-8-ribityllumazine synthase